MKILDWIDKFAGYQLPRSMLRRTVLVVFVWAAGSPVYAQLMWANKSVVTNLPLTAITTHVDFCFTNAGATPAHLGKTYSTCGCAAVLKWPSSTVPAGAAGKIIVKIDVSKETGILAKTVYLNTDNSAYVLNIIIKIPELVDVSPRKLLFDRTNIVEQSVIFSNMVETAITLKSVTFDSKFRKQVRFGVRQIVPGRVFAVDVTPSSWDAPYDVQFNAVVQEQKTGIEKSYRFQAIVN